MPPDTYDTPVTFSREEVREIREILGKDLPLQCPHCGSGLQVRGPVAGGGTQVRFGTPGAMRAIEEGSSRRFLVVVNLKNQSRPGGAQPSPRTT